MNRSLTNFIRFFMDECLPPIMRDSKIFMYPFFYVAYRGKNIKEAMDFKSLVYKWTQEQYAGYYGRIDSISRNRPTDLNEKCIDAIMKTLDTCAINAIDIGCGKGYLLNRLKVKNIELHGCDVVKKVTSDSFIYHEGNITALPFADKSFDVVMACHTLEHIIEEQLAISELKRIARRQLIIVVPCQRYFYYTLDEHVNFYPVREKLVYAIGLKNFICQKLDGDWFYAASVE